MRAPSAFLWTQREAQKQKMDLEKNPFFRFSSVLNFEKKWKYRGSPRYVAVPEFVNAPGTEGVRKTLGNFLPLLIPMTQNSSPSQLMFHKMTTILYHHYLQA
jgi:hypothetical protein